MTHSDILATAYYVVGHIWGTALVLMALVVAAVWLLARRL